MFPSVLFDFMLTRNMKFQTKNDRCLVENGGQSLFHGKGGQYCTTVLGNLQTILSLRHRAERDCRRQNVILKIAACPASHGGSHRGKEALVRLLGLLGFDTAALMSLVAVIHLIGRQRGTTVSLCP